MTSFLLGDGVCWGPGSGSVVDNDIEMAARCLRRHQRVLKGAAGRGQRERRRRRRNEDRTGERAWVGCAQGAGGSGTGAGRRNWGHASPDRPTRATQATKQPSNQATQAAQATTQAMSASQKCTLATVVPRVFHHIRRLSMSFAAPGARHRRCLRVLST